MDSAAPLTSKRKILFVCVGNICRSAALEAALKKEVDNLKDFEIASAGVSRFAGDCDRDCETVDMAKKYGLVISGKSRRISSYDFERYDLILAATFDVFDLLQQMAISPKEKAKVSMATFCSVKYRNEEIPSPIGHGSDLYKEVLEMVIDIARSLAQNLG